MKELYTKPELEIVYFASMQRLALETEVGLGDPASNGNDNNDMGLDIIP